MTDSLYRPSGRRKGTHLRGQEISDRLADIARIERKRYHDLRFKYHCAIVCDQPLQTLTYDMVKHETPDAIFNVPVAILTCAAGHVRELRLSL